MREQGRKGRKERKETKSCLAAGSSERIDHRSLQPQHEEALSHAAIALNNEEKALWLAKAVETNRPAMKTGLIFDKKHGF